MDALDYFCTLYQKRTGIQCTRMDWAHLIPVTEKMSVLFGADRALRQLHQHVSCSEHKTAFRLDDVARCVVDILSRQEECVHPSLDRQGRYDGHQSGLVALGLGHEPIVDQLMQRCAEVLGHPWNPLSAFDGVKAIIGLSHDVDRVDGFSYLPMRYGYWLGRAGLSLFGGQWSAARRWYGRYCSWRSYSDDPLFAFDRWMALESEYDVRSTFFFMSLKRGLSIEGRRYTVTDPRIKRVVRQLVDNGWEVGLHAGRHNAQSLAWLKDQKRRLEDVAGVAMDGCRQHWLNIRLPESWELYHQAGFKYSSNMGWTPELQGFRAGTALPYPVPGFSGLYEIPFQMMDRMVIQDPGHHVALFDTFLKQIKAIHGCLVLDFHQEYFDPIESPGVGDVYRTILQRIRSDTEIIALPLGAFIADF
ncbi:MAG: hypothetical protein HQL54_12730 [Magnetococcales bacterium]|nr:hypothetical protein [Magnetococcales bacterium]